MFLSFSVECCQNVAFSLSCSFFLFSCFFRDTSSAFQKQFKQYRLFLIEHVSEVYCNLRKFQTIVRCRRILHNFPQFQNDIKIFRTIILGLRYWHAKVYVGSPSKGPTSVSSGSIAKKQSRQSGMQMSEMQSGMQIDMRNGMQSGMQYGMQDGMQSGIQNGMQSPGDFSQMQVTAKVFPTGAPETPSPRTRS